MLNEIKIILKNYFLQLFRAVLNAIVLSIIFATIEDIAVHFLDNILIKHTINNIDVSKIGFFQCFSITLFLIMSLSIYGQLIKKEEKPSKL